MKPASCMLMATCSLFNTVRYSKDGVRCWGETACWTTEEMCFGFGQEEEEPSDQF